MGTNYLQNEKPLICFPLLKAKIMHRAVHTDSNPNENQRMQTACKGQLNPQPLQQLCTGERNG